MVADVLLVGCGDLGAGIGRRLADRGHAVVALRRRAELVPAPLVGRSVDLTVAEPDLTGLDPALLVVCLTARPRTEAAYRATYVDGMRRALDALDRTGARPHRAVLVSSTGVIGPGEEGVVVDESTPPDPADAPARVLLEAEQLFAERVLGGTVLRCSGLYRGGGRLLDEVRSGRIDDSGRWTNRVHRDDAAEAVVHLLTTADEPGPLYLATDDEPALRGDVATFLADRAGLPRPELTGDEPHGKRLSNALLRSTGWTPRYPTFREGYATVSA